MLLKLMLVVVLVFATSSCKGEPEPEPIEYGKDSCAYCLMLIGDAGFSAELKTKKGKVYKFDSIECLAAFILSGKVREGNILAIWVADFPSKKLVKLEEVKFLISQKLRSPMALNISAFVREEELKQAHRNFKGKIVSWKEVLEYVREKWKGRIGGAGLP